MKILLKLKLVLLMSIPVISISAQNHANDKSFTFIINYKTIKPVVPKHLVLYYGVTKKSNKSDSIVYTFRASNDFIDTVHISNPSMFPLFIRIKLECTDISRKSNEFYFFEENNTWELDVNDKDITVRPYQVRSFHNPYKPYMALVLLLQAIIELILAFMLSKMIGWSRVIMIMVLAANIVAFPIYLLNFPTVYMRELIVLVAKILVMSLIGYKRISIYKIMLFAIVLTIISLGLKEILFVLLRIV